MTTGLFIAVVGSSGVGKDTVLLGARDRLAKTGQFHFATRTITRPPNAGGEDHFSVSVDEFVTLEQGKEFCLSWSAHGLRYGIPKSVQADLENGTDVICNISRKLVVGLDQIFERFAVVEITASSENILRRLKLRGRESAEEIENRASRDVGGDWSGAITVHEVTNDGALENSIEAFSSLVIRLAAGNAQ